MENNKYQKYFSSLSLPDLLHITVGCQKRFEEGKPCEECSIYKKGNCDGKRVLSKEEEDKIFFEDLLLEEQEQM